MQASTQPLLLGPAAAAHDPASLQHISAAVVQTTQCITQRRLFQPQAGWTMLSPCMLICGPVWKGSARRTCLLVICMLAVMNFCLL